MLHLLMLIQDNNMRPSMVYNMICLDVEVPENLDMVHFDFTLTSYLLHKSQWITLANNVKYSLLQRIAHSAHRRDN